LLRHLLVIWKRGRQHHDEIKEGEALTSFDQYCHWVRDPLLGLGCKDPIKRIDELKLADPKRELQLTVFREWWRAHRVVGELRTARVTAHGLSTDVCVLIDPDYGANSRAAVISTLASWRGVRVGGFVLEHNADRKGKHSPTKYWLTRTEDLPKDDD